MRPAILEPVEWFALGALATFVTALVAHRVGFIQITIMRQAHQLNIAKAMPKIGTSLTIDKRQEHSAAFGPSYYLIATIYNEGDLPAQQLKGHCKLFSPINEIKQQDIPIDRELVGRTSPYKLEERRIEGTSVDAAFRSGQHIRINVDIEFDFLSIPDDRPQHYSAKYEYDNKGQQMIKVS
jgi:hypothetical protein